MKGLAGGMKGLAGGMKGLADETLGLRDEIKRFAASAIHYCTGTTEATPVCGL